MSHFSPMSGYISSPLTAIGAGRIGESVFGQRLSASALSLVSGTSATVVSITLSPGVWDVWGYIAWQGTGTGLVGVNQGLQATWSTATGDNAFTDINEMTRVMQGHISTGIGLPLQWKRINVSANSTYNLVTRVYFSGGTCTACGWLQAVRRS